MMPMLWSVLRYSILVGSLFQVAGYPTTLAIAQNASTESKAGPVLSMTQIRLRLGEIDLGHSRNMDDYIHRCSEVEALLPEMYRSEADADKHLAQAQKGYADRPELLRLIAVIKLLNEKDKSALHLLDEETRNARVMASLPSDKRQGYFDAKIEPLQEKMKNIAREEIRLARKAQKDGILPPGRQLPAGLAGALEK